MNEVSKDSPYDVRLQAEVTRIANELSRLVTGPSQSHLKNKTRNGLAIEVEGVPSNDQVMISRILKFRRLREEVFGADLFADPAWDMLLDLYGAHLASHRVSVSSLCVAAAVPATTALRWIKNLEDKDFLSRRPDPLDARRIYIELTDVALDRLTRFFANVRTTCPELNPAII